MPELKKTEIEVVVVCGSPRKEGSTANLLNLFLNELTVFSQKIIFAYDAIVHPCNACGYCHDEFGCIFHDSMDTIYHDLSSCSLLIIASPIYFSHLPAPLKLIIDRCQIFWEYYNKNNKPKQRQLATALIIGGSNYSTMFMPAIITLRHFFNTMQYEFDEEKYLLLPNINSNKDIKNDDIISKVTCNALFIKQMLLKLREV